MQQDQSRTAVAVKDVRIGNKNDSIIITTERRTNAVNYAISISGETTLDVAHDLSGIYFTAWTSYFGNNGIMNGWLPHLDLTAISEFQHGETSGNDYWRNVAEVGTLNLDGQLDLWQMLTPTTQPLSKLDYTPEPESVTIVFKIAAAKGGQQRKKIDRKGQSPDMPADGLFLAAPGAKVEFVSKNEARLTVAAPQENRWQLFTLSVTTLFKPLDVFYFTSRDPRPRALPTRRILLPFAVPGTVDERAKRIPEIAGGDWNAGRDLFKGKATCVTCHQLRGDGFRVGPELSNLPHRDYASVLKDIADPNAAINPDAVGYIVTRKDGTAVTGTRIAETAEEIQIAQPGGVIAKLKKADIATTEPMKTSLMPAGLDKALSAEELRDLMTYLLLEAPPKK